MVLLVAKPASAHRLEVDDLLLFMFLNLLPGEVGVDAHMGSRPHDDARVLVGFPYQIGISPEEFPKAEHRALVDVQLATSPKDGLVRGLLGYRFVPNAEHLLVGGGASLDGSSGMSIYGEFGGRAFLSSQKSSAPNVNVVFRFERSLVKDETVRSAVMIGWAFY
jgi:hypothetical protein